MVIDLGVYFQGKSKMREFILEFVFQVRFVFLDQLQIGIMVIVFYILMIYLLGFEDFYLVYVDSLSFQVDFFLRIKYFIFLT